MGVTWEDAIDCLYIVITFVLLPLYPIGLLVEHLTGKEIYYRPSNEPGSPYDDDDEEL